jgi:hypothetical protein
VATNDSAITTLTSELGDMKAIIQAIAEETEEGGETKVYIKADAIRLDG